LRYVQDIDWQRSSNRLAILTYNDQKQSGLWSMTSDGKERRLVYQDANFLASLQWAPTGDVIYCLRKRNKTADVIALDLSSQELKPRVLLSGLPEVNMLSIGADGRSMLMVRGITSAHLVTLDITQPTNPVKEITKGTEVFEEPRVSPDGRWIVAVAGSVSTPGSEWGHIVKIPLAGGDAVSLTPEGKYFDWSPSWSPDGKRIAFTSDRFGKPSVWVMSADGQELKPLALGPVGTNMEVTWTPDGQIAWQQDTIGNHLNYRLRNLTSGQESFLANSTEGYVFDPRFSPLGDRVAVYWNRPVDQPGLWVLSWPKRAETFLRIWASPLGWSPDGQSIYARKSALGEIWVVGTQTGAARLLASVPAGTIGGGDATPDGKYLVLSVRERKADAWLVENFDPGVR
jgi:Tol biopolymer transport system component